jgi:amino acid adenylation domain-containing protein
VRYLLHHLLEAAAGRRPERVAVAHGERALSYAALETRANQLARLLAAELGVRRGDRVGILMDKSVESLVAVYGALKAGAAYVPLDVRAPAARLAYVTRDCGVACLLTGRAQGGRWAELAGDGLPLRALAVLDAPAAGCPPAPAGVCLVGADAVDAQPASPPGTPALSLDLAYILYTSGSTGHPKGVMLTHRAGLAFVEWAAHEFAIGPEDRLSSHAPLHFDLSVFDVFAAALGAARTVLVDARLAMLPVEVARLIREREITTWYSVPSILALLAERGGLAGNDLPHLRTVLFAGEVFPSRHLRRLMELLPGAAFHNLFGPTETNVCTAHRVARPPADGEPIPIGRPVADVDVYVARADGTLAAEGEVGELCVRGATLMRGYWGDEERTARSLVPNPWAAGVRDDVYRTGDFVRRDAAGDLWFAGRRDDMVKSRGYRIALGDVEAAVLAHASVEECVVVPVPDELVTCRLLAWVVCGDGLSAGDLKRFCALRVPGYMVPEWFEFRAALPRTSSGKVDRRSLLEDAIDARHAAR